MTLTTHAVSGAVMAVCLPKHPEIAITVAFASHFVVDMCPHGHYPTPAFCRARSATSIAMFLRDRGLWKDIALIFSDFALGAALATAVALVFAPELLTIAWACAIAAEMPDFLQFGYVIWPRTPILQLQKLHVWAHPKKQFNEVTERAAAAGMEIPVSATWMMLLVFA